MADERRVVLVAVDPSDFSEHAFDWYVKYMHQAANEVICLFCLEQPDVENLEKEGSKRDATCSKITELEERYMYKMEVAQMNGRVIVQRCKRAGEAICDQASRVGAFSIVTGTRGRGTIERKLLGSISEYCVKNSSVPVIVVRKKAGE